MVKLHQHFLSIQVLRMLFLNRGGYFSQVVLCCVMLCYGPAAASLSSYLGDREVLALLAGLGIRLFQEVLEAPEIVKLRCLRVSSASWQHSIASLQSEKNKNSTCRNLRDNRRTESREQRWTKKVTFKDPQYLALDKHFEFLHDTRISLCVERMRHFHTN